MNNQVAAGQVRKHLRPRNEMAILLFDQILLNIRKFIIL
ncbi:hypothetical protein W822_07105 [Advenella kashmirensis W13003]|uniref:Uncharacterized protein n=1 Tax=Advenella kashmirensis W13003 TaxID=1424334 RepID=V8QVR1_9BURK|nr:hypothetical protein W822_07105 [Advenella kashmirensis W13003]